MPGANHHCDYNYPGWTIYLNNNVWHRAVTIMQRMAANDLNLALMRGFADAVEYEYLRKRRELEDENSDVG